MNTLGKKLSELRKAKGMTQDDVAEKLGVSAQAVSKWENDMSCPDIMLLPGIAEIFGVAIDDLFSRETKRAVMLRESERKPLDELLFRIVVNSADGDKVKINLPMPLLKMGLELGMAMPQIADSNALKGIDLEKVMELVEKGVVGKLLEAESGDGDVVEIVVE